MTKLTTLTVSELLSRSIFLRKDSKGGASHLKEVSKQLTYSPLTRKYHLQKDGTEMWPEGESNVSYAVAQYNSINLDVEFAEANPSEPLIGC